MKNLKKLDRNELKFISGNGLFDGSPFGNIFGPVADLFDTMDNVLGIAKIIKTLDNGLCEVQCTLNNVIQVKVINCNATTC